MFPFTGVGAVPTLLANAVEINYKLRVTFATDDPAPIAGQYVGEVGSLDVNDTSNTMSVASGVATPSAANTAVSDPRFIDHTSKARAVGRAAVWRSKRNTSFGALIGYYNGGFAISATPSNDILGFSIGSSNLHIATTNSNLVVIPEPYSNGTYYTYGVVLLGTGHLLFINGNCVFVENVLTTTPLYPAVFSRSAGGHPFNVDFIHCIDFTGDFATGTTYTLLQASPANNTNYAGDSDGCYLLTVTAQATLAGTTAIGVEMRYRVQDANNYWTAYFREDGRFRVDSVIAGTPTNYIDIASAITNGATRTIQIIANDTFHNAFTQSGAVWTARGSQINQAALKAQSTMNVQIGSGWSVSNLRSQPRTSSKYAQFNPFLA